MAASSRASRAKQRLFYQIVTLLVLILTCLSNVESTVSKATTLKGHLKPIFSHGTRRMVEVLDHFPSARTFFTNFVNPAKPLLIRGGSKLSPAYQLWTDQYFLSFPEGREFEVTVEQEKKEIRTFPAEDIPFTSFIEKYRNENIYLVNSVPDFLRQDFLLPPCISCPDITNGSLVHDILWFSSGGTKSVLHNDYAENIICVLRGSKEFYLVDKIHMENINVTEKGYSDVDVERVDLTRFPGLYNLEHWHTVVAEGDCLYVPLLWVHQVTSHDRNIAVNIWWKNNLTVDFSTCNESASISLRDVQFMGFDKLYEAQYQMIKNRISHRIRRTGSLSVGDLLELFHTQADMLLDPHKEFSKDVNEIVKKVFIMLDQYSTDNVVTMEDVNRLNDKDWEDVRVLLNDMMRVLGEEADRQAEEEEEEPDDDSEHAMRDEL